MLLITNTKYLKLFIKKNIIFNYILSDYIRLDQIITLYYNMN